MARTKGKFKTKPLPLSLIEPTHTALELLVNTGIYGNNPTEVAKTILLEHLRELERAGKIRVFPNENNDKK